MQAIGGDRTEDAAHNLPCQILVNGQFPWQLVSGSELDRPHIITELRSIFGGVYKAPKVFNTADSIAEANCLRGALATACRAVIVKSRPRQRQSGVLKRGVGQNYGTILLRTSDVAHPRAAIDADAVGEAFQMWLKESNAAFTRAIQVVQEEGASSMGNDVTADVIYILERYASSASAAAAPSAASWSNVEQRFWRAKA